MLSKELIATVLSSPEPLTILHVKDATSFSTNYSADGAIRYSIRLDDLDIRWLNIENMSLQRVLLELENGDLVICGISSLGVESTYMSTNSVFTFELFGIWSP